MSLDRSRLGAILLQGLVAASGAFAAWYFISNAARNLLELGVATGFGFLAREAGFEIGETTFLSYSAADT
ncbi:MAG: amino acid ABC transporter permease, partial [Candidatus Binatia bacterium]